MANVPTVELLEKYQIFNVRGDGNCQFRAVSRALYGTEERHQGTKLKAPMG